MKHWRREKHKRVSVLARSLLTLLTHIQEQADPFFPEELLVSQAACILEEESAG